MRASNAGLPITGWIAALRLYAVRNPQLFLCPSPPSVRSNYPLPSARSFRDVKIRGECRLRYNRYHNLTNAQLNVTTPLDQIEDLSEKIAGLDAELRRRAGTDDTARWLTTIPDIGPITAAAITTFAPPMETFSKGRDFAAWVGLTPRQHSSGGKERLGRTSKMGQKDILRLLITGAIAVVRWSARKGAPEGSWLARMLARKPKMLVAVALANRMARTAWALMRKGEDYRDPVAMAA